MPETTEQQRPRVSVILPARNEEEFVGQAIESLLRQTEHDIEVIAVDDGSADGTGALIEALAARDARVKPLHQGQAGIVEALNHGLSQCRGSLIARMDADDISRPGRLRKQAEFLDQHADLDLVATRVNYTGDAGRNGGLAHFVDWTNALIEPDDISLYRFVESPLIHPSVMFRRELPQRFGAYRDGPFPEDYELWLRWLECGARMAKLTDVLLDWCERPERLTRTDSRYSVEAFYQTKAPYLYRWLARNNRHHPDVVVWGAGRTSRQRMRYLIELGVKVKAYVDVDPRKIGYRIGEAEVIWPDAMPGPESCFVLPCVGRRGARAEIESELQRRGFCRGQHYLPFA